MKPIRQYLLPSPFDILDLPRDTVITASSDRRAFQVSRGDRAVRLYDNPAVVEAVDFCLEDLVVLAAEVRCGSGTRIVAKAVEEWIRNADPRPSNEARAPRGVDCCSVSEAPLPRKGQVLWDADGREKGRVTGPWIRALGLVPVTFDGVEQLVFVSTHTLWKEDLEAAGVAWVSGPGVEPAG